MNPLISIITVTYNAGQWLERTIQSVLNQSYAGIQYIIIDGKSTDTTVDIIKKHESRIHYWKSEPDTGLYDAMNKGLAAAGGDYVLFLNAGDLLYSNTVVGQVVELIQNINPDIIYGETEIINSNTDRIGMRRLRAPEKLTWKSFRMGMLVSHQSFFVKRSVAPEYDLQYKLVADFDWCIRCLKQAEIIYNSHQIISKFMDEGLSSRNRKASLKERYEIMSKYYGRISTTLLHFWFAIRFYYAKYFLGRV